MNASRTRKYTFGVFHFDVDRLELFRGGRPVPLQPQPAHVLAALLQRAGQVVTRDELRRAVWPEDTFVDFDRGLNFCVAQIRTALADTAHAPRYVRTLPKRGYEFICPLVAATSGDDSIDDQAVPPASPLPGRTLAGRLALAAAAVAALALIAGIVYIFVSRGRTEPIVAVARFDDETGDPQMTRFADALADTVVEHLTNDGRGAYKVIGNAAVLRRPREQRDLQAIGSSLHAQFVVLGQVQRDKDSLRVLAHLIRLPDQTHVIVSRTDSVSDETLAGTDALARKIAATFETRLGTPSRPPSSHLPTTR